MDVFATRPPKTEQLKVGQDAFLAVIWSGVAIALFLLLIRLFARWKSFKRLYADDALVVFAWLLAFLTAVDWQIVAKFMYRFLAVTSGQLWPPPPTIVRDTEQYNKGSVVVFVFFYTSLWAVKLSFLSFFKRLGRNVRKQKVLWWCVFAFTVASYVVCVGITQYSCLAPPLERIIRKCTTDSAVRYQHVTLKFNAALDVVTDFAIMAIPISMLWRVQMPLKKKVALTGIFSLAVITAMFAIIRMTVTSASGRLFDVSWLFMWSSIEQCVAIIVCCLASFRGLFVQQGSRLQETNSPSASTSASRNRFFLRSQKTQPIEASVGLTELNKSDAPFTRDFTCNRTNNTVTAGDATGAGLDGYLIPPNSVHVKREVHLIV